MKGYEKGERERRQTEGKRKREWLHKAARDTRVKKRERGWKSNYKKWVDMMCSCLTLLVYCPSLSLSFPGCRQKCSKQLQKYSSEKRHNYKWSKREAEPCRNVTWKGKCPWLLPGQIFKGQLNKQKVQVYFFSCVCVQYVCHQGKWFSSGGRFEARV